MTVSQILLPQLIIADVRIELNNWLINAFNGEWLRTANAVPLQIDATSDRVKRDEDVV